MIKITYSYNNHVLFLVILVILTKEIILGLLKWLQSLQQTCILVNSKIFHCLGQLGFTLQLQLIIIIIYSLILFNLFSQCDLEAHREISKGEGELLARSWQCPFFETSAKERINIDETFHELVRRMKRYQSATSQEKKKKKEKSKKCVVM